MFEKEAFEEWKSEQYKDQSTEEKLEFIEHLHTFPKYFEKAFNDGYNKGKEEIVERLDNATEIIELMKDLFFDCWQEKGLKAIQFEQRVNDFLKGE